MRIFQTLCYVLLIFLISQISNAAAESFEKPERAEKRLRSDSEDSCPLRSPPVLAMGDATSDKEKEKEFSDDPKTLFKIAHSLKETHPDKARDYYKLSADKGNPAAQYELSRMFYFGKGGEKDFKKARYYIELAAEYGSTRAQFHLARMLYLGIEGPKDLISARAYFKYLSTLEHSGAQYQMGTMLIFS